MYIHKPCSTNHQTGFIVRINCVRRRQEISKHIPFLLHILCCIELFAYMYTVGLGIGCNFRIDYQYILTDCLID